MDNIAKGILIAILVVAKLLITGFCLAIGFKLGYAVYEKAETKIREKQAKAQPAS